MFTTVIKQNLIKTENRLKNIKLNLLNFQKLDIRIPVGIPVNFTILTGTGIPANRPILTGTGILPGSRSILGLHYGLHLRSSPYSPSLFWATQETNSHGHSLGIDAAILTRHSGKRESTQKQAKFSRITSCLPFYPILEYLSDSSSKPLPFNLKVTKMH